MGTTLPLTLLKKIHYRTKVVVYQSSLQLTMQCTAVKPMHYFVSVIKELTQAIFSELLLSYQFMAWCAVL